MKDLVPIKGISFIVILTRKFTIEGPEGDGTSVLLLKKRRSSDCTTMESVPTVRNQGFSRTFKIV